jgi:hypothetical protein
MKPEACFAAFLLLVGCGAAPAENHQSSAVSSFPTQFQGAWQEEGPLEGGHQVLLRIEPDRMVEYDDQTHSLIVRGFVRQDGQSFQLRKGGLPETWTFSTSGSVLRLERIRSEADPVPFQASYRRLDHVPAQLDLQPLPLPPSRPLPADRIRAIQAEVQRRFDEEQAVLKDPAREKEFESIRQRNLVYLEETLKEVGWLDAERFGGRTSMQAIFMAKHTNDLRLMLTILPFAEQEFKRAGRSQTYAILYDAVQLELGRKQRYGTQVQEDAAGPFVLPLEDPERVDDYLRRIGLPSLAEYRTHIGHALYEGKEVRVRKEDGPQ